MKDLLEETKAHPWFALWIIVGVPVVVYLLSELQVFPVGGTNDWAGFWGAYLGSIIGGIITLYVMGKTIKIEKTRIAQERKRQFDDEILEHILEYHSGLLDITRQLIKLKAEENFMERAAELTIKSGIIYIKIKSRNQSPEYHCDNLLETLRETTRAFNDMVALANSISLENISDDDRIRMENAGTGVNKKINDLRTCIEKYYIEAQKE